MKQGILVVSFGTTYRETREKSIETLVSELKQEFPAFVVEQAYTSNKVRTILQQRDGIAMLDVKGGLERMKEEQVEHLAILPTHMIDGVENNLMKRVVEAYREQFPVIAIMPALLERQQEYPQVAYAIWEELKEHAANHIVVFMGHGSHHAADLSYGALQQAFCSQIKEDVYIATVEGSITIQDVIAQLEAKWQGKAKPLVLLAPLMFVAGDHAIHDMVEEEDSFYHQLRNSGFAVEYWMKGLGEYQTIRNLLKQQITTLG